MKASATHNKKSFLFKLFPCLEPKGLLDDDYKLHLDQENTKHDTGPAIIPVAYQPVDHQSKISSPTTTIPTQTTTAPTTITTTGAGAVSATASPAARR